MERRVGLIPRGSRVSDANPMMESARPELDREVGSDEHSSYRVGHSEMSTVDRTILIGSIGTSRTNLVVVSLAKVMISRLLLVSLASVRSSGCAALSIKRQMPPPTMPLLGG